MPLVETFIAYDKQQNKYKVNVHEALHKPLSGVHRSIRDYSIADTGELLEWRPEHPKVFRITSSDTMIVDIR